MFGLGLNIWEPINGQNKSLEGCIKDGTLHWLYDAERGLVEAAGNMVTWTAAAGTGLTASDVLIPISVPPAVNPGDVNVGGRKLLYSTLATSAAQSAVPATSILVAVPLFIVRIGHAMSVVTATSRREYEGAVGTTCYCGTTGTTGLNYAIANSTVYNTLIPEVADEYGIVTTRFGNAGGSYLRSRTAAGVVSVSAAGNSGALSMTGVTLFGKVGARSKVGITAIMCVTGLSGADQIRLDSWCQQVMGWL